MDATPFAYDSFVQSAESVTVVQRELNHRFNIHQNNSVATQDTILHWVSNLRTVGLVKKKKPSCGP